MKNFERAIVVWTVKRGMRSFIFVLWQCNVVAGLFLIVPRFRLRDMLGCKHNVSDEMDEKITLIILRRHFTSTGHQRRWAPSKSGAAPSTVIHNQTLQSLHQLWLCEKSNTRSYLWYFLIVELVVCLLLDDLWCSDDSLEKIMRSSGRVLFVKWVDCCIV